MRMLTEGQGEQPITEMRPLDPRQIWVLRVRVGLAASVLLIGAFAIDSTLTREIGSSGGVLPIAVLIAGILAIIFLPLRRYRAWGFAKGEDELHIRHGVWTRVQTAVPFGRVQHIDVAQGPIERRFGLARLILHTAGTRSAAIPLPGLRHDEAEALREQIRSKIRQDLA